LELDRTNPRFRVNGQEYTYDELQSSGQSFFFTDTILFSRLYNGDKQSFFDKSLRSSLGLSETNTDFINVDALNPDQMSIDMFSPEELLLDGSAFSGL
jgi:hypothetical protein